MKKTLFCLLFAVLATGALRGAETVKLPSKEKFFLVLLAGQSNMAGRGFVVPEDKKPHPRVLMLNRELEWVPAVDPVHFDKRTAGVGPGRRFAELLAESDPSITVGLIPTACGGSPISAWRPGEYFKGTKSHPYDDCLKRARRAMRDGTLKVILWHQGESDCNGKKAHRYEKALDELVKRLRSDLGAADVPFIAGQLSQWKKWNQYRKTVDAATRKVVAENPPAAFATSEGLTHNPDKIHFDRGSQRIFAERYFKAYQSLVCKDK